MAKQTPNAIKGWFITFAKPVQQQFWDWIDSFRHKDDPISFDDLDDQLKVIFENIASVNILRPEEILFEANGSFSMLAKYRLNNIGAINNTAVDILLNIGTTNGGDEICSILIPASGTADIDLGVRVYADTTIYVTGVTGSCTLLIDRK